MAGRVEFVLSLKDERGGVSPLQARSDEGRGLTPAPLAMARQCGVLLCALRRVVTGLRACSIRKSFGNVWYSVLPQIYRGQRIVPTARFLSRSLLS